MLKNDSEVAKTLENIKKVKNYSTKTVKVLSESSKNTQGKNYGKGSVRLVASGNWFNEEIYHAMLIVLKNEIELAKTRNKLAKEVFKGIGHLGKTA